MKFFPVILIFLFSFCSSKSPVHNPQNLIDAIHYFERTWSNAVKDKFKNQSEEEASSNAHFNVGMWIRNNWIRGSSDTNLVSYFHSLGVYHPDDMSSIILVSLHRKLNGKEIDLSKQVESIKTYWEPIIECHKKQREQALVNFNKYVLGSSITILMKVDTTEGERNAVIYDCPDVEWTFNPEVDLIINGVLQAKYHINDTTNVFFKVRVKKVNFTNTEILSEKVKTGDTVDFSLRGLTIVGADNNIQCKKCDVNKVKAVNEHLDRLTFTLVEDFLCTFDNSCKYGGQRGDSI